MSPALGCASVALAEGTTGSANASTYPATMRATMSVLRSIINLPGSPNRALAHLAGKDRGDGQKFARLALPTEKNVLSAALARDSPTTPDRTRPPKTHSTALVMGGRPQFGQVQTVLIDYVLGGNRAIQLAHRCAPAPFRRNWQQAELVRSMAQGTTSEQPIDRESTSKVPFGSPS